MSRFRIAAILLIVLIVSAVAATVMILDRKYQAIWCAPALSHEDIMPAHTHLRLVIKPDLAGDSLIEAVSNSTGLPTWTVTRTLPQEVAIMLGTDFVEEKVLTTAHINERRFGPVIVDQVNRSGFLGGLRGVMQDIAGLEARERGALLVTGSLPLNDDIHNLVWVHWNPDAQLPTLPLEGGHFIEAVADNRSGGALAALGSLAMTRGDAMRRIMDDEPLSNYLAAVSTFHMYANLNKDDALQIHLEIACDEPDFAVRVALPYLIDTEEPQGLKQTLAKVYGVTMTGQSKWDGDVLVGDYLIADFDNLLRRMLPRRDGNGQ